MDDTELNRRLRAAPRPSPSDGYWQALPGRVLSRVKAADRVPSRRWARRWPVLLLGSGALTAAALVLGIWIGQHRRAQAEGETYAWLRDAAALREVLSFFPHRVEAVVEDAHGIRLVLSDSADVPDSPAVWIELQTGSEREVAVTFSGQELQFDGQHFEVLSNPRGEITLVGDRVFWSSSAPRAAMGALKVQAKDLGTVL